MKVNFMSQQRVKQDTHNYQLKDGKRIVYQGISKNPEKRLEQHKRDGKKFTHMTIGPKRSRERANSDETKAIHRYQKSHRGKPPKYNINKTNGV